MTDQPASAVDFLGRPPSQAERASPLLETALVPESLASKVVDLLIEAMVRGDLPPGSRIREATLARQLGISRGPLREALRRLEGRKLVQHTTNLGMRVTSMSRADIISIFEIREALEGMACRLATEKMSDAELNELAGLLDAHRSGDELREGSSYYQFAGELDIHYRIALGSRNDRLVEMLCEDIYHLLRIYRFKASLMPGRAHRALDEHSAIVAAMRARDPDKAEALMRAHIRAAVKTLRQAEVTEAALPQTA